MRGGRECIPSVCARRRAPDPTRGVRPDGSRCGVPRGGRPLSHGGAWQRGESTVGRRVGGTERGGADRCPVVVLGSEVQRREALFASGVQQRRLAASLPRPLQQRLAHLYVPCPPHAPRSAPTRRCTSLPSTATQTSCARCSRRALASTSLASTTGSTRTAQHGPGAGRGVRRARRVHLVRRNGRDVSTLYGREGGGGGAGGGGTAPGCQVQGGVVARVARARQLVHQICRLGPRRAGAQPRRALRRGVVCARRA